MIDNYFGLTKDKVKLNRNKFGSNELKLSKKISSIDILVNQFFDPILFLLLIAVIVSFVSYLLNPDSKSLLEVYLVLGIVIINITWSFIQEYRAQKTLISLQNLNVSYSNVVRDGELQKIDSREVVFDDIININQGEIIRADIKLIQSNDLIIDESFLTGESEPKVKKRGDVIFSNSRVLNGYGVGSVIAVGENTQMGKIADQIHHTEKLVSFLELKLKKLTKLIVLFASISALIIFLISMFRGMQAFESLEYAVTILIATIPEGLPTILSIVFTVIARKSSKQNALVKDVRLLETLGQVDYICSDKTGTLTENKMRVVKKVINEDVDNVEKFTKLVALPNSITSSSIFNSLDKIDVSEFKIVDEIVFTSVIKYNALKVYDSNLDKYYIIKFGAPESLIDNTSQEFSIVADSLAHKGMRVLVNLFKEVDEACNLRESIDDEDFDLVGIYGLKDPVKRNMISTISKMHKAGINVVMVTGDHVETAKHIAREVRIFDDKKDIAISGEELSKLSDEELFEIILKVKVFGRVTPEQKLKIVQVLQEKQHVVAMLGDGTNDAIAIKQANVGVAMGSEGTDIAKEAADLIILDDDFSSINSGILNGRIIFDNVQKFLSHMLSVNLASFVAILFVLIITKDVFLALTPALILWINFISDGIPALTLGFEKEEVGIMQRKPLSNSTSLLNNNLMLKIIVRGLILGILVIVGFLVSFNMNYNYELSVSISFLILSLGQLITVFESRVFTKRFRINMFNNLGLLFSFWFSLISIFVLIYSPLNTYFGLVAIPANMLFICLGLSLIPTIVIIIIKPICTSFILKR